MKLTKQQLRQIIKEELTGTTRESLTDPWTATPATTTVDDILNQAVEAASSGNHRDVVQLLGRAWVKAVGAGDDQAREAVNQMAAEINQKWPEVFGEGLLEEMGGPSEGNPKEIEQTAAALAKLPGVQKALEALRKDPNVAAALAAAVASGELAEDMDMPRFAGAVGSGSILATASSLVGAGTEFSTQLLGALGQAGALHPGLNMLLLGGGIGLFALAALMLADEIESNK